MLHANFNIAEKNSHNLSNQCNAIKLKINNDETIPAKTILRKRPSPLSPGFVKKP